MVYLAESLKKFYKRENGKIVFVNKMTLNQLSLEMWEKLGFHGMDATTLSKVLKGKRLFTEEQLGIFCEILYVTNEQRDELFFYLNKDMVYRSKLKIDRFYVTKSDFLDLLTQFTNESEKAFDDGRLIDVLRICDNVEKYLKHLKISSLPTSIEKRTAEISGLNIYLRTKTNGCSILPQEALFEAVIASQELLSLSKRYNNRLLWCYSKITLAHGYYVAGGVISHNESKTNYQKAINYAKEGYFNLSTDNQKTFALRLIASSAAAINDVSNILLVCNEFDNILHTQSEENALYMYSLAGDLAKGAALLRQKDPFIYKKKTIAHFGKITLDGSIHETSDIKKEIETYLRLDSHNPTTIQSLAKKGLSLANKYGYARHQRFFENVVST